MKYFDKLTVGAENAFADRGVNVDNFKYCVKADLDSEGCYYDVYIVFDSENLYVLSGRDRLLRKRKTFQSAFDFEDYKEFTFDSIDKLYVDRYQYTSRLILKNTDGTETIIARFSAGFAEKFEQFCRRLETVKKGEIPDDSMLDDRHIYCPKCGEKYPDPNRKYCPKCTKRSSIFLRLVGLFKDYKLQIITIFAMLWLSVVLQLVAPYFGTKLLYDEVLTEGGKYYGEVLFVILCMISFTVFSIIFEIISGVIISSVTPHVIHKLRVSIFSSMQRLSLSFFTNKQTGSLMTRVDSDSSDVYFFLVDILPTLFSNVIKIAGLIFLMFGISIELSLCMFGTMAVTFTCQFVWYQGQRRVWRSRNIANRAVTAVLGDAVNGHRVVKAFAKEDEEINRFGKKNYALYKAEFNGHRRNTHFAPIQDSIYTVMNGIIYCLGVYFVLINKIELGALTLLISYFGLAGGAIGFFIRVANDWARCTDSASRMFEILDSEPQLKEPEEPAEIPDGLLKGEIEFKDVSFEYVAGVQIIKNLSFKTKAGQFTGIVGRTGAGKSTIINLISRMYDVTAGEIRIDGIPVKKIPFDVLRKSIGVVSQETYLFMGTIADNIRYARPEASMDEVIEAAKNAGAHDFIMQLPDGYDTVTGSGGISLSGGEKQRISIARALIQKPNILILDEATAAMDTATERKIQLAIDNLKKGRTIIAIAHRLSTLRDADNLCVIENGELKESGTHDELIHKKGKYFDLYKLQSASLKAVGIE